MYWLKKSRNVRVVRKLLEALVGLRGRHEPIGRKLLGKSETAGNSNIFLFVSQPLVPTRCAMFGPPDPDMEKAASAKGSPKFQSSLQPNQNTEVASALQEKKFHRLYSFCQRTVSAIMGAIYRIAETEQTRKIEALPRERAEARG
jgi:hypothetical protein